MEERDWDFPTTLSYIYVSYSKFIDGYENEAIKAVIKEAIWEWIEDTQQKHRLDEFLTTAYRFVEEDINSENGIKTVMSNFFWLGEHLNDQLKDSLKSEVMNDLGRIAIVDGDLNETKTKWLNAFSRALGTDDTNSKEDKATGANQTALKELNNLHNSEDVRNYVQKILLQSNAELLAEIKTTLLESLNSNGFIEGVHGYLLMCLMGKDLIGKSIDVELSMVTKPFTSICDYTYEGSSYRITCDGSSDERAELTYEISEENIDEILLELSLFFAEGTEISTEADVDYDMLEYEIYADTCVIYDENENALTDKSLISEIWNSVDDLYDYAEYTDTFINYSKPKFYINL